MSRQLADVQLLPGQAVRVVGPKPLKLSYDRARTYTTVTAPGTYVNPVPPLPSDVYAVWPSIGKSIATMVGEGKIKLRLHGGNYHESFGSTERHEAGVELLPFGDGAVVFDGTGLAQNWLYLGAGAGWTLGAITLRNFRPIDSGIIGIGDGCHLERLEGFKIVGAGPAGPWPATSGSQNSHGIYLHGTGTTHGTKTEIVNIPGAAMTSWRGSPRFVEDGGRFGSHYISALVGAGRGTFNGVDFTTADGTATGPIPHLDVHQYRGSPGEPDADPTATAITNAACTGTGADHSVRRTG